MSPTSTSAARSAHGRDPPSRSSSTRRLGASSRTILRRAAWTVFGEPTSSAGTRSPPRLASTGPGGAIARLRQRAATLDDAFASLRSIGRSDLRVGLRRATAGSRGRRVARRILTPPRAPEEVFATPPPAHRRHRAVDVPLSLGGTIVRGLEALRGREGGRGAGRVRRRRVREEMATDEGSLILGEVAGRCAVRVRKTASSSTTRSSTTPAPPHRWGQEDARPAAAAGRSDGRLVVAQLLAAVERALIPWPQAMWQAAFSSKSVS